LPGHFLAEIQPQFVEDNILDAAMAKYIVDGRKGAPKEVGRIYNMGPMGQVEWDGEKWVQLPAYKYDAKRDSNPPLGTKLADGTVKDRINTAPIKTYPTPDGPSFWPYELIKPEIQHQPMAGPIQHREPMIAGEFAFNASRLLNFLTNASPEEREKVEGKLSDEQKEEIDALRALLVRILASIEQASQKSTPPAA
jgi:hypothetical protein